MKHAGKRVLSTVCALALLAAMLPAQAFAVEPNDTDSEGSPKCTCTVPCTEETPDLSCPVCQNDVTECQVAQKETAEVSEQGEQDGTANGEEQNKNENSESSDSELQDDGESMSGNEDNNVVSDGEEKPADTAPTARELQQRINALPAADALATLDDEARDAAYREACAIEDALAPLSEEEKAALDTAKLDALFTWFNEQVSVQPEDDPTTPSEKVAQIGNTPYATLDDAIANAQDGDTIELLADATISKTLDKSMVIEGNNHTITSTNKRYGFTYGRELTFKDVTLNFTYTQEVENPTANSDLGLWYINGNTKDDADLVSFTFENVNLNMSNTGATNRLHAIYFDSCGGAISFKDSQVCIEGFPEDAIEWGGKHKTNKIEITNTHFISKGNRSGFTGTWNIFVNNSTVEVLNSTANASNGSNYYIKNSTVKYLKNAGHGLSASDLVIENSHVTAKENGYYGVYVNGEFLVDKDSTLEVCKNSAEGDFAGLKITDGVADGSVEAGAIVTITDNYCSGLSNNGHLNFEEGAVLTITGNNNDKGTTTKGGGIYNSGNSAQLNLPSNATICNNHAINTNTNNGKAAGDDIFNNTTATITFGKVGTGWKLSDCKSDDGITVEGCTAGGVIDGWYDDSADEVDENGTITSHNRWNAHDGDDIYHVEKFDDFTAGKATVSRLLCLKAAHNAYATLQPADVTIYMGGAAGYQGVLEGEKAVSSNSLPEPGFYFTLPADLNTTLSNVLNQEVGTASDLSSLVTVSATTKDGTPRNWTLERYGVKDGSSTAMINDEQEQFIYKIVPAQGQDPIRVVFTDSDNNTCTSDTFDPETALYNTYEMDLYTGGVDVASITMTFTIPGENDEADKVYTCGYDDENSKEGTLTIRYASDNALTTQAKTSLDAVDKSSFGVVVAEKQSFYINEQDYLADNKSTGVEVAASDVSLLADNIINEERVGDMYSLVAADAGFQNISMFAKYFDLVDTQNGNAWLTPADGTSVKVFWPYPAGTDKNTTFKLYHFEGLDRELQVEDVAAAIAGAPMTPVSITKEENGITFDVTSFSPFVLAWDKPQTSGGNDDNDGGNTNPTPASTPAPTAAPVAATPAPAVVPATVATVPQTSDDMPLEALIVVTAAAAAAFVALLVVRKRRHGNDRSHP